MTENLNWSDLESQLQETKQLLEDVEQRFLQVRRDSLAKQDLLNQQEAIRRQLQEGSADRLNNNGNSRENINLSNPHPQSKIRRRPSSSEHTSTDNLETELKSQLQEISDRLEQLEVELESRLLSWSSFREPFWQMVRFGGLGVVIGIILRSCAN